MPDIIVTVPDASLEDVRTWMVGQWAPHAAPLLAAGSSLADYAAGDQVSLILAGLVALAARSQQHDTIAAQVAQQFAAVPDLTAADLGVASLAVLVEAKSVGGIAVLGPGGKG